MKEKKKTNKVTCADCGFGIATNSSERTILCDNPNLKTHGKNVKHGYRFCCGYGVMWNEVLK